MKLIRNTLVMGTLLFAFSCAHQGGKNCCHQNKPHECVGGQCKVDKSCCKNKCNKCTGDKESCKKGQCKLKK